MWFSSGSLPPPPKEVRLWHDDAGDEQRGMEREKKSWQTHKAVWLHHGHVAAFTNTVWSNLTSLPSSLPLSVSRSLQNKVPFWHIGLKNYVNLILYICTDVLGMEITSLGSFSVKGRIQKLFKMNTDLDNYWNIHTIKKQYDSGNNRKTFYKGLYVTWSQSISCVKALLDSRAHTCTPRER